MGSGLELGRWEIARWSTHWVVVSKALRRAGRRLGSLGQRKG